MKTNSIISTIRNPNGTLTFGVVGAGTFTFDPTKASAAVRDHATIHGFTQRISDGAALAKNQKTGASASAQAKFDRMQAIAAFYEAGGDEWAMRSAGGGAKRLDVGQVVMALIECGLATDVDVANSLISNLAGKRNIERDAAARAWLDTERVAVAFATIAARSAKVDADDLLAEAMGESV